jgi:PiT family inorganic phosphate transporter
VGATQRLSAVRWGIAGSIVWAWILTIPLSGLIAAMVWGVTNLVLRAG